MENYPNKTKPAKFVYVKSLVYCLCLSMSLALASLKVEADISFETVHLFPAYATNPHGGLVQANDGNFYGTTEQGGAYSHGTVYKLTQSGFITIMASFDGTNGAAPMACLIQGPDGNFYGTAFSGDVPDETGNNYGTVFKISPSGTLSLIASFGNTNGANPTYGLVLGKDGNFFGSTETGGAYGAGTVYKIKPTGELTCLHSFAGDVDGADPIGELVQGLDGNFYGVTVGGLNNMKGTIFKITPTGELTTLVEFSEGNNEMSGIGPSSGLVKGADGYFYGLTTQGGNNGFVTAYRVTTNGDLTSLVSFDSSYSLAPPVTLTQDHNGNFYGTTATGNGTTNGGLFKISPAGDLTMLFSFHATDGAQPWGRLAQGTDGNFYGTTEFGGKGFSGTAYKMTSSGAVTSWPFLSTEGENPKGGLIQGPDGSFYGTASGGSNRFGVVFKTTPSGHCQTIFSFGGTNGTDPLIILSKDGNFYGTTTSGSPYSNPYLGEGNGSAFKLTQQGKLTTLKWFDGYYNGFSPQGFLESLDGNFYGTTLLGGTNTDDGQVGLGTVFKLSRSGQLTTLVNFGPFSQHDGYGPNGGMVQGPDGNIYGTTMFGGENNAGTVFKITPTGAFLTIFSFSQTNGAFPFGGLTRGWDGSFYGTTEFGGDSNAGTVFKISFFDHHFTSLYSFAADQSGYNYPNSTMILGHDGNFFGTTTETIFTITPSGTLTTLYNFRGPDNFDLDERPAPQKLSQARDGKIYGVTHLGGQGGDGGSGTIFRMTGIPLFFAFQPTDRTNKAGTTAIIYATGQGAKPIHYQWQKNSVNLSNSSQIFGVTSSHLIIKNTTDSDAGSYTVIISNAAGSVTSSPAILSVTH